MTETWLIVYENEVDTSNNYQKSQQQQQIADKQIKKQTNKQSNENIHVYGICLRHVAKSLYC